MIKQSSLPLRRPSSESCTKTSSGKSAACGKNSSRDELQGQRGRVRGGLTGVQALGDGGGVDQVALAQAACDVGVDVTQVDLPRQHVGVLRKTQRHGCHAWRSVLFLIHSNFISN